MKISRHKLKDSPNIDIKNFVLNHAIWIRDNRSLEKANKYVIAVLEKHSVLRKEILKILLNKPNKNK
ncbi:hypothetical protein CHT99_15495 [Sphingobacterium cellulitidis]|nr:hypothetical protein CHT99_15495 [Sphingobacterium cellulitidis]